MMEATSPGNESRKIRALATLTRRRRSRSPATAGRTGEQTEGEEQRQRAEARHQQINVAGPRVLRLLMMRDDQRPGGERHELPGDKEAEGVVREDDNVHSGEERRVERQHPAGVLLVLAVPERIKARGSGAEIDDGEKESRQSINTKTRADPR